MIAGNAHRSYLQHARQIRAPRAALITEVARPFLRTVSGYLVEPVNQLGVHFKMTHVCVILAGRFPSR